MTTPDPRVEVLANAIVQKGGRCGGNLEQCTTSAVEFIAALDAVDPLRVGWQPLLSQEPRVKGVFWVWIPWGFADMHLVHWKDGEIVDLENDETITGTSNYRDMLWYPRPPKPATKPHSASPAGESSEGTLHGKVPLGDQE